jgi:hypothetical protein
MQSTVSKVTRIVLAPNYALTSNLQEICPTCTSVCKLPLTQDGREVDDKNDSAAF